GYEGAEVVLVDAERLADLAHDLAALRRREHAPLGEHAPGLGDDLLVGVEGGEGAGAEHAPGGRGGAVAVGAGGVDGAVGPGAGLDAVEPEAGEDLVHLGNSCVREGSGWPVIRSGGAAPPPRAPPKQVARPGRSS